MTTSSPNRSSSDHHSLSSSLDRDHLLSEESADPSIRPPCPQQALEWEAEGMTRARRGAHPPPRRSPVRLLPLSRGHAPRESGLDGPCSRGGSDSRPLSSAIPPGSGPTRGRNRPRSAPRGSAPVRGCRLTAPFPRSARWIGETAELRGVTWRYFRQLRGRQDRRRRCRVVLPPGR